VLGLKWSILFVGIAVFIIVDATQFNIFSDMNPRPWTFRKLPVPRPQRSNVVAPSAADGILRASYASKNGLKTISYPINRARFQRPLNF
jgi:hypothetical protein